MPRRPVPVHPERSTARRAVEGPTESLGELRARLLDSTAAVPEAELSRLEKDPRAGVRQLAATLRKRAAAAEAESARLAKLLEFERELWAQGYEWIAGVDEAGVGPCAGPLCAGAAILPRGYTLTGLDDSKKILDEGRRDELADAIKRDAVAWAVGWAQVEEIDALNPYQAGLLAMRRAVQRLSRAPEYLLVDARTVPGVPMPQRGIIKGDAKSLSIAAGAILAKTTRDHVMVELDARHPGYGFAAHKGYPTPEHLSALERLGALPCHRRSYAPVKKVLGLGQRELL